MKETALTDVGQTGRGFITPILQMNIYYTMLIDKNKEFVDRLSAEESRIAHYFGDRKEPVTVTGHDAYVTADEGVIEKLAHLDLIMASVFAGNIKKLVGLLSAAAELCGEKQLRIAYCEDGVHVEQPLADTNIPDSIPEGVILCTTLQLKEKSLALINEDVAELPVNGSVEGMTPDIVGMLLGANFPSLI